MAGAPIFDPARYARLKAETPPPQGPFGGHPQGPEILAHLKTLPRAARAHWWRKNQHRVTNGEPVLDPREHPPDDVDLERPPPDDGLVAARRTWARDWAGELDLRRARLKVIEGGGEASAPAAPRLKVIGIRSVRPWNPPSGG